MKHSFLGVLFSLCCAFTAFAMECDIDKRVDEYTLLLMQTAQNDPETLLKHDAKIAKLVRDIKVLGDNAAKDPQVIDKICSKLDGIMGLLKK